MPILPTTSSMPVLKYACLLLGFPLLGFPLLGMAASTPDREDLSDVRGSDFEVTMYQAVDDHNRQAIGTIVIRELKDGGVRFIPDLTGLEPGEHGFHIHRFDRCQPNREGGQLVIGTEAGEHLDPEDTGRHAGPEGQGHMGDLPVLVANAEGEVVSPVEVQRLRLKDITGRALIIHAGGDNYADEPEPNGGGGLRIACGVIKTGPMFTPR